MAYNKRGSREESPVRFKDGQPVFREERAYYNKKNNDRSYGDKKPYGKKRFEGEEKPFGKKRFGDEDDRPYGKKRFEGEDKPYKKNRFEEDERAERENTRRKGRDQQAEEAPNAREDELPYLVMGRNAVREAIRSGRSIDRILVSKDPDGSLREILSFARDRNLRIDEVDRSKLDSLCMPFGHGGKTGNHQGIVAQVPGVEYCDISDMLDAAREKGEKPFIILLDGIEDPHNLGSIIRSAVCAGAHGVIFPKRRAVSVTAAASKASAGAVEHCKVARVANLSGAISRLKDEGLWIAGADMQGTPMGNAKLEGAIGLVIGGEGEGLSRLVRESCDFMVSVPMYGDFDSLNASVAAAVLMFEKRRQDSVRR